MSEDEVLDLIYEAVDEVNDHLMPTAQLPKSRNAIILGDGGSLDSLAVVNLLAAIEDKLEARGKTRASLLNLLSDEESAAKLRTVETVLNAITGEAVRQ